MNPKDKASINHYLWQIKNNNFQNLEKLCNLVSPRLYYIGLKYLNNEEDAKDVVQDLWLDIDRIVQKYHFKQNGFSFLCKVMQDKSINKFYKTVRENRKINDYVQTYKVHQGYERGFDEMLLEAIIDEEISKMDELSQKVVIATYFENKTIREIAKDLDISKSKIYNVKKDALQKLKSALEEKYEENVDK